ncbi:hypothetical protein [Methylobacterium sp. WL1]|uniref:hypothetical protein n=1 Tax=Methylobacterium sp. WL1 TaxID=2603276 RepID=UPI0011C1E201|nr:hypothetical protein [Methylobacterium sp. WL1]QEE37615.1 hypothetical protein FVA80_00235 [Methylobacterium sp. WL1]TXN52344.1 hypothetical protein FV241_29695 [Methylobacterium sp. WL2]
MIALQNAFGPWRPDVDPAERLARLRAMRAIARVTLGPRGDAFTETLRKAETDPDQLGAHPAPARSPRGA